MHRDVLYDSHPAVSGLYFLFVLLLTMCVQHPLCVLFSLCGAFWYHVCLYGGKKTLKTLPSYAAVFLLTALINPAFQHQGVTVLGYLPSGNPLTLESILYGLNAAGMLSAVLVWFSCVQTVFTTDKLLHVTGRAAPAVSLVISMTLRFVPRFRAQASAVRSARQGMGITGGTSRLSRMRDGLRTLSVLLTWSMENALETGDSMRARGYGLPGRTSYSPAVWSVRDRWIAAWTVFCGAFVSFGAAAGGLRWKFYPAVRGAALSPLTVGFFVVYGGLCITPAILNRWEVRKWKKRFPSGV